MQEMNYKVTVKRRPYKVAKAYLKKKGLLNNQVEIPGIELSGILFINRLNVIDFKITSLYIMGIKFFKISVNSRENSIMKKQLEQLSAYEPGLSPEALKNKYGIERSYLN